jgi:uncharacterized protein (DUF1499 family)
MPDFRAGTGRVMDGLSYRIADGKQRLGRIKRRRIMNTQQETLKQTYTSHAIADAVTWAGFGLAILAGISAMLAGLGARWGWWYFVTGFTILQAAAIGGIVAALVSLVGGISVRHEHHRSAFVVAAAGIFVGLVTAGIPWSWYHTAKAMPPIYDISTDMTNPPQFDKIMPLRKNAENSAIYEGSVVAAQQQMYYPDIRPVTLPIAELTAFDYALKTAKDMGWQIVDANASAGRIEAIATTFWFGFKDDVVVRITSVPGGSRVDVRSVSRVGSGDMGTNSNRIRSFLSELASTSIIDPKWGG